MRIRPRKFRDGALQRTYDRLRADPPINLFAFGLRGTTAGAYVRGFQNPERADDLAPRGSIAYAAWAAGVDNAKATMKRLTASKDYHAALRVLQGESHQMLSRNELNRRGVSNETIDAAIARGDVYGGPDAFSSIVLTVDGEQCLQRLSAATT